jgi:hypothetical protein
MIIARFTTRAESTPLLTAYRSSGAADAGFAGVGPLRHCWRRLGKAAHGETGRSPVLKGAAGGRGSVRFGGALVADLVP